MRRVTMSDAVLAFVGERGGVLTIADGVYLVG